MNFGAFKTLQRKDTQVLANVYQSAMRERENDLIAIQRGIHQWQRTGTRSGQRGPVVPHGAAGSFTRTHRGQDGTIDYHRTAKRRERREGQFAGNARLANGDCGTGAGRAHRAGVSGPDGACLA